MGRFSIPRAAVPQLWTSALNSYDVAADITGSQAASPQNRNGKAVNHPSGTNDPNGYSGLGFFSDRWGNQIWITEARGGKWAIMQKYGLWGRTPPIVLPMARFVGHNESGENALLIQGKRDRQLTDTKGGWGLALDYSRNIGIASNGDAEMMIGDFRHAYTNVIGALQGIDVLCQHTGKPLPAPIVILLIGEPITAGDILSNAVKFTEIVINVIAPFAASIGVPELQQALSGGTLSTIQQVAKAAQFFADGGAVTLGNVGEYLLPIVGKITPEQYLPTFNDATTVYKAVLADDYATVARTLGVSPTIIAAAGGDVFSTISRLGIVDSSTLATANDILHNVATIKMTDVVSRWGGQPVAMVTELLQHNSRITAIPFVQEMFLNAAAGSAIQIVPNLPNVLSLALSGYSEDPAIDSGGFVQWGGMALTALGFPTAPELFDPLAYASVREQVKQAKDLARQVGQTLSRFTFPASVPTSKRAEYAEYLREDEGISVDGVSRFKVYAEYP